MKHVHGLEVTIVQKGAFFLQTEWPAQPNITIRKHSWSSLSFRQFSWCILRKKRSTRLIKELATLATEKAPCWHSNETYLVVISNRTACISVFYKAKFRIFLFVGLCFFVPLCNFTLQFLSCMAFSVYEIVRVACLSRSWFAYAQLRDKQATRMTSYTLKALQKNLCS